MDNNNASEKIMLKILISQLNTNIENKFELLSKKIEYLENSILANIKENYVNKKYCKDVEDLNNKKVEVEEISYKKIIAITSAVTTTITIIANLLLNNQA